MPGFNQQGPEGSGPITGRGRGMCRRTEDLDVPVGGGRGQGNRCRTAEKSQAERAKETRKVAQASEAVPPDSTKKQDLAEIKKQFSEASVELQRLSAKIEAIEKDDSNKLVA